MDSRTDDYEKAYKSNKIMHPAITLAKIIESLLFRIFTLCIRLLISGKRSEILVKDYIRTKPQPKGPLTYYLREVYRDHSGVRKNWLHVRKSVNSQGFRRPKIIVILGCQDTSPTIIT